MSVASAFGLASLLALSLWILVSVGLADGGYPSAAQTGVWYGLLVGALVCGAAYVVLELT